VWINWRYVKFASRSAKESDNSANWDDRERRGLEERWVWDWEWEREWEWEWEERREEREDGRRGVVGRE
jgi:hypothetical protein